MCIFNHNFRFYIYKIFNYYINMSTSTKSKCEEMKSTKSYGYRIPKILNVTLNNRERAKLVYSEAISIDLEPPTKIEDLTTQLNMMMMPGQKIKPYTYAVVELEDILFLTLFQDSLRTIERTIPERNGSAQIFRGIDPLSDIGNHILTILESLFRDYIAIGQDGKKYLMFFRVVGSNMELYNKHGSLVSFLKNAILDNFCELLDDSKLDYTDVEIEIFDLYYYFGAAGELLLSKRNVSSYDLNFNFLSGTLMQEDYNADGRLMIANNSLAVLLGDLNPSYKVFLKYNNSDLIGKNIDKTDDAISLMERGIKLYYIRDPELIQGILKNKYLTNLSALRMSINILIHSLRSNKILDVKDIDYFKTLSGNIQLKSYNEELHKTIGDAMNELMKSDTIRGNESVMRGIKKVSDAYGVVDKDLRIKQSIKDLMVESNRAHEGELKRVRGVKSGGKRKNATHKKKRSNKKRNNISKNKKKHTKYNKNNKNRQQTRKNMKTKKNRK